MEKNHYFAAAHPPAPFHIAVLSIIVQMGGVALAMLAVNFVYESYIANTNSWWKNMFRFRDKDNKRYTRATLEVLTNRLIDAHKSCFMIVALNEMAEDELVKLGGRFALENFVFCRMDKLSAKEIPEIFPAESIQPISKDDKNHDIVAIEQGGERWLGFNIIETQQENLATPKLKLGGNVVECWLMHLLLGRPTFIEAKVTEVPINLKALS